jgi:tRNA pseudouridine55 synthase
LEQIRQSAGKFLGVIEQTPPPFSAKKINGVPAYKLARKKKDVALQPVRVEIKQFDISRVEDSRAHFAAQVASGTYLRSIAHEMGQVAGCGAHLESLRRTSVGEFQLEDAHTLAEVEQAAQPEEGNGNAVRVEDLCIHPRKLLPSLPSVTVTEEIASKIWHGMAVNLSDFSRAPEVKVFSGQRDLIAIASRVAGTLFHPRIVLV